jgi:hypothetical protein
VTGPAICPTGRHTNGSATGPTPKSSPHWPPPSCCSPRSRSSRPAAATPCCLCGYCATATAPANLITLGWAPASSACSSSSRVHAGRLGLLRAKHRRGLPPTAAVLAGSGAAAQLVPRVGARPLLLPGSAVSAGGLCWPSRIGQHATYTSGLLQARPAVRAAFLVARSRVREQDSGVASSLLNTGRQIGGSIGSRCSAPPPGPPWPAASAPRLPAPRPRPPGPVTPFTPGPGTSCRAGTGAAGRGSRGPRGIGPPLPTGRSTVAGLAALSCLMPRPKIPPAGAPLGDAKPMQRS